MDENAKELKKRGDKLFAAKAPFDSLCQEIALNFYAARADFTGTINLGDEFASHLADSYPELVRRDLANAFSSMLRPSNTEWFKAHVDEELERDDAVKAYLEYMTKVNIRIMYDPATNMRRSCAEADNDIAAFGNAVVSIVDNKARDGMVMRAWHLRDCSWAEDENGQLSSLHRKQKISLANLVRTFGDKALPQKWKSKFEKDPLTEIEIRHCAIAAQDYDTYAKKKAFGGQPWVSVFYTEDGDLLQEIGEPLFPYVVPRWQKISTSPYAFSPSTIIALPNARLIQRMMITLIESAEKTVDPPLIATHEAIKSDVDLSAGGITWVDREYDERLGEVLRPLQLGKNVGVSVDLIERQRQMLAEAFYLSKLQLPQAHQKTAYETARLVEEYVRNALPLFEPLEDEYNSAILEAVTARAIKLGAYGPKDMIPQALRGKEVRFKFANPLREAMDKRKIGAFQETGGLLAQAAQIDPGIVREMDVRTMFRDAVRATGAPVAWLKADKDVEDARAKEEAKQAAAEKIQQLQATTQMIGQGADAMTKVAQADQSAKQMAPVGQGGAQDMVKGLQGLLNG